LNSFVPKISNFFSLKAGHKRSIKAKKNILQSFIVKGLNMLVSFTLVPITINYLSPTTYGVWITITSIVAWFGFFDVGLGHGLRNRFAEAIANKNHKLARQYVSTTYAVVSILIISLVLIFIIINPIINWNSILNISNEALRQNELTILSLIIFSFFGLNFVFQLVNTLLTADQNPSAAALIDFIGKAVSLLIIWFLVKEADGSIIKLGFVLSGTPVVVLMIASIYLFKGRFKQYMPSISYVDFTKAKDLLNLGIKFFIIRISAILLYSTNSIIISQLFGPDQVTPYSISMSYFNTILLMVNIVVSPFWSAITEAWVKKEYSWIKKSMNILIIFWIIMVALGILMVLVSKLVYRYWIGEEIQIAFSLSFLACCWVLSMSWNSTFSQFLYGVGAVRLQAYLVILLSVLNLPLAIILGKKYGVEGILMANILVSFVQMFVYPIQYYKIINFNAKGIWRT